MKSIGTWPAGIAATVIAGVILWLITQRSPPPPPPPEPDYRLTSQTCSDVKTIKWWDLDSDGCVSSEKGDGNSDFTFKFSALGIGKAFCMAAMNGAKFAAFDPDRDPWSVSLGRFETKSCEVPQNKFIPCVTSQGSFCQFQVSEGPDKIYLDTLTFLRFEKK
jgi:hypothetical protein